MQRLRRRTYCLCKLLFSLWMQHCLFCFLPIFKFSVLSLLNIWQFWIDSLSPIFNIWNFLIFLSIHLYLLVILSWMEYVFAMYRSVMAPNVFSEQNSRFKKQTKEQKQAAKQFGCECSATGLLSVCFSTPVRSQGLLSSEGLVLALLKFLFQEPNENNIFFLQCTSK